MYPVIDVMRLQVPYPSSPSLWSVNGVSRYMATTVISVTTQLLPTFLNTAHRRGVETFEGWPAAAPRSERGRSRARNSAAASSARSHSPPSNGVRGVGMPGEPGTRLCKSHAVPHPVALSNSAWWSGACERGAALAPRSHGQGRLLHEHLTRVRTGRGFCRRCPAAPLAPAVRGVSALAQGRAGPVPRM